MSVKRTTSISTRPLIRPAANQHLDGMLAPEPWMASGLCAQTDPEVFFPEKGGSPREAKRVCAGCEVISECLTYALEHDEAHGVWGGLSPHDRRRLTRRRGTTAETAPIVGCALEGCRREFSSLYAIRAHQREWFHATANAAAS